MSKEPRTTDAVNGRTEDGNEANLKRVSKPKCGRDKIREGSRLLRSFRLRGATTLLSNKFFRYQ